MAEREWKVEVFTDCAAVEVDGGCWVSGYAGGDYLGGSHSVLLKTTFALLA